MVDNMINDNSVVDCNVKLRELTEWRLRRGQEAPYYIPIGECGLLFNGNPATVRNLWRTYNIYRYNICLEFVSYLNAEGVEAKKVAAPIDRILGYPVEVSN